MLASPRYRSGFCTQGPLDALYFRRLQPNGKLLGRTIAQTDLAKKQISQTMSVLARGSFVVIFGPRVLATKKDMNYYENVLGLIGHTPLIKLNHLNKGVKPLVLAKMENLNPGFSVKDRIGISMIEA